MSDTTDTTTETPTAAPAAPVAPALTEATSPAPASTQTASPGLSAPTPETSAAVSADPASDPAPAASEPITEADTPTETTQEGAQPDSEGTTSPTTSEDTSGSSSASETSASESTGSSEDSAEAPAAAPQVVNDDSGQHVVLPDGTKVYTRHDNLPRSNAEQATFELTHSGDQLRYPYKPGDKEYNAYSDPAVPNSHLARMVETEIVSYAERVLDDPKAAVSTMWNALKGVFDGELAHAIETGEGSGKIVEV
jgi:hypothetical protein